MAFLGTEKLRELIESEKVIEPNLYRISCGAYELSLGDEAFRTDSTEKRKEYLTQPKEQVTINPGQFALLLTMEKVKVPINKIAFISIKAGIKLRGLVNVSGFHVDPGFNGNLLFSVYNAGSGPISLVRSEPCFLIWFADLELTENEMTSYARESHEHKNQDTILPKYIDALLMGELASPNVLLAKINSNFTTLNNDIDKREKIQEGKIGLIERDNKANNYIGATALGLVIVLIVKFLFDWTAYSNGIQKGIEMKEKELQLDSTINRKILEKKILLDNIDSLQKIKVHP